ncbi:hypothetical protein [Microcoleus sp. LEGE 07076]|nr:hypothetical protein [Microcoleus sp. LEGE 07076]
MSQGLLSRKFKFYGTLKDCYKSRSPFPDKSLARNNNRSGVSTIV